MLLGRSINILNLRCQCRNWKKLYPGLFTLKVEVPTCDMMVMDVHTKGTRPIFFSPLRALVLPTVPVTV